MTKASEWIASHKLQTVAIAVVVVLILAGCGIALYMGGKANTEQSSNQPTEAPSEQAGVQSADLIIKVTADKGWDAGSTPAIAHIMGETVDFYHAINPDEAGNTGSSSVALAPGDYAIEFISPVNTDGSAYKVSDTGEAQQVMVNSDTEAAPEVTCAMVLLPADQVIDPVLQGIVSAIIIAIENGDATLKGESGKEVLTKLDTNVSANPNVTDQTKAEATSAKETTNTDTPAAETITPARTNTGNNASNNTPTSSGSNNTPAASENSGNSGGSSIPASSHTHVWVDHTATKQVWVPNIVTVPDFETQTIYGARFYTMNPDGSYTANGPTYWFENGFTEADLDAIVYNALLNSDKNGLYNGVYYSNYQNVTKTDQIQVGSHQEDQGYYENQTYVAFQYCSSCGLVKQ